MDREQLYLENEPLVYHFIKQKKVLKLRDFEDIVQELKIALWKATAVWKPSQAKFSTLAMNYIANQWFKYFRDLNYNNRKANLNTSSLNKRDPEFRETYMNLLPSDFSVEDEVEYRLILDRLDEKDWAFIRVLNKYERNCHARKELGVSLRIISVRKQKIIQKIVG